MSSTTDNFKIYKNGDSAHVDLCFTYPGPGKKSDVTIVIDGLTTDSITLDNVDVSKGIFNAADSTWSIAALIPGKQYCATVYFTIDDTCILKNGISFTLDDNCGCGPDACTVFTGLGCCELLECVEEAIENAEYSCELGAH